MNNKFLKLFLSFFKIGALAFGGGYGMIPMIRKEVSEKHKWLDEEEMVDIIAISEVTPGPIAVNIATFIGYRVAGVLGAAMATLGVVLPSLIIIIIVTLFLRQIQHLKVVKGIFFGIKAGVMALIVNAIYSVSKQVEKNIFSILIMALTFIFVAFFSVDVILVIICAGIIGLVYSLTLVKGGAK